MKNKEFKSLYIDLLSQEWKGKQVWEYVRDKEMTVAPHFEGAEYENSNINLIVVGRAVNGWEVEFPNCDSIENTLTSVLEQSSRFNDVINPNGVKYNDEAGNSKTYYYSKSPFWRLVRKVCEEYNGTENWNERIVWSNLYKVAPRRKGNPKWSFIKSKLPTYIECIKKEIEIYKPSHILFITDMNFFNPYKENEYRFGYSLNVKEVNGNFVVGKGEYNGAKVLVCKRPEYRDTDKMVKEINEMFK